MDRSATRDPIETFLVERYWPDVDLAQLQAAMPRLEAAVGAMTAAGQRVTHQTILEMALAEYLERNGSLAC